MTSLFGRLIARRREALDMSQARMASLVGMSAAQLSRLENDERELPRFDMAIRIADVLGVSLDDLADGERDQIPPEEWEAAGFEEVDEIQPGRVYEAWGVDGVLYRITIMRGIVSANTMKWHSTIDMCVGMPLPTVADPHNHIRVWTNPVGIPQRLNGETPSIALRDAIRWLSNWAGIDPIGREQQAAESAIDMAPKLKTFADYVDSVTHQEAWRDRDRAKWSSDLYDIFGTLQADEVRITVYPKGSFRVETPVSSFSTNAAGLERGAALIKSVLSRKK